MLNQMSEAYRMQEISTKTSSENVKGRDYSRDQVIDGKIIIKWVLQERVYELDLTHLRERVECQTSEHGD